MNELISLRHNKTLSPKQIYTEMSNTVIGQVEAKRAISVVLYLNYVGLMHKSLYPNKEPLKRPSILLAGPSGNGKTFIIQQGIKAIQKLTNSNMMPLLTVDCTALTAEGWSGPSISTYIEAHVANWRHDNTALETAIMYFDEFDKLCQPAVGTGGTDHHAQAQYSMLKLLEHTPVILESNRSAFTQTFDVSNFLFMFSGNFPEIRKNRDDNKKKGIGFHRESEHKDEQLSLHKQLQNIGLKTQLAGRISQMVEIKELTKVDLERIVRENIIPQIVELFDFMDYTIYISNETVNNVVETAVKNKTGARGLQAAMDAYVQDELFEQKIQIF